MREQWRRVAQADLVAADVTARVSEHLDEQVRSAEERRDQINA